MPKRFQPGTLVRSGLNPTADPYSDMFVYYGQGGVHLHINSCLDQNSKWCHDDHGDFSHVVIFGGYEQPEKQSRRSFVKCKIHYKEIYYIDKDGKAWYLDDIAGNLPSLVASRSHVGTDPFDVDNSDFLFQINPY